MFKHNKINKIDDFFLDLNKRPGNGVYFYRICGYCSEIENFIIKYYNAARTSGVVVEGRIQNPDEKNLSYYNEMMGTSFQMSIGFIGESLKSWLPRMNITQRNSVATAIYDSLDNMRKSGKNENMLRNAYIKIMCWLYYKFERVINKLGENTVPKVLYEGNITYYELVLLSILSCAGCDIVILEYNGDENYLKLDSDSKLSDKLVLYEMTEFPKEYNIKYVRQSIQKKLNNEKIYGDKSIINNCTNAWMSGNILSDIATPYSERGIDKSFFYNCFCQMNGVENKLTFQSELIQFHTELLNQKRKVVIVENSISPPVPNEINNVKRGIYQNVEQMIMDLSTKIYNYSDATMNSVLRKAFIDVFKELSEDKNMTLMKLVNIAVYLICWYRRFQTEIFNNWKNKEVSCFIKFGVCQNSKESIFLKFLARLPIDVVIFNPSLNDNMNIINDKLLYNVYYPEKLNIDSFPDRNSYVQIGTAAYHAERELDTLMYQDSGMYRNMQYRKASTVILRTMYEEISVLWDEELKYRPNFITENDSVIIPVIFAKVSGVKDGNVSQYWSSIKPLITEDTFVIKSVPFIAPNMENTTGFSISGFLKNGKLQRSKICSDRFYRYGFLRDEIQNHILDKLQLLIDSKMIKGTFENGVEYKIVSVILAMNNDIVRMIQKFDFTKKNPKIIYINTSEKIISLEDSILMAFLSLIGFDIVFFVPTGYRNVENYYNDGILEEHQIGEYVYDLGVPDFRAVSSNSRYSWREKIFKRGR